jgi:hypothetical protein
MAGDSDTRPRPFLFVECNRISEQSPSRYSGRCVTASILWPSGSKTKPP